MIHSAVLFSCAALSANGVDPLLPIAELASDGRITQEEMFSKDPGFHSSSADELTLRDPGGFQQNRIPSLLGVTAAPPNQRLADALQHTDLSKRAVLDGYPASKMPCDPLTTLRQGFATAQKRSKGPAGRGVNQELKGYNREFDFLRQYFPAAALKNGVARQVSHSLQGRKN